MLRATQAKEVASKWQLAENSCSRSPLLHQLYYYRLTTWGRPQTLHPQEIPVFFFSLRESRELAGIKRNTAAKEGTSQPKNIKSGCICRILQ